MKKFSLCSFFGISAPLAVILPTNELEEILSIAKVSNCEDELRNLSIELKILENSLTSNEVIRTEYDYDKLYMYYGKVLGLASVQNGDKIFRREVTRMIQHFGLSVEIYTTKAGTLITKELWKELKENFDSNGRIPTAQVYINNENKALSEVQYKLLRIIHSKAFSQVQYGDKKVTKIKWILNSIEDVLLKCARESQTIFGYKLNELVGQKTDYWFNSYFLKSYAEKMLSIKLEDLASSSSEILDRINMVVSVLNSDVTIESKTTFTSIADKFPKLDLDNLKGISSAELCVMVNESLKYMGVSEPNSKSVTIDGLKSSDNLKYLMEHLEIYNKLEDIVTVCSTINVDFWRSAIGDNSVTSEELENAFNFMNQIGILGLNMYTTEFAAQTIANLDLIRAKNSHSISEDLIGDKTKFNEIMNLVKLDLSSKCKIGGSGVVTL